MTAETGNMSPRGPIFCSQLTIGMQEEIDALYPMIEIQTLSLIGLAKA